MMYRAMIVDDEQIVLDGLQQIVRWEDHGFRLVKAAHDGREALEYLERHDVDLVITDIRMPSMDGLAFIERLSREYPRAKLAVLSAYDEFAYAQRAMGCGVRYYILKPTQVAELHTILDKVRAEIEQPQPEVEGSERLEAPDYAKKIVLTAVQYVHERYRNAVDLDGVAAALGISKSYFCHVFKREQGVSFGKYLVSYRLERARRILLSNRELRIGEIAGLVGYDDQGLFCKLFKKRFGASPLRYRQSNRDQKKE